MRMAFSLASAPPLVKNTLSMFDGAWARIFSAAMARVWLAWEGATVASVSSCCLMASMRRGCWWPMLVLTSWLEKSRYVLPSWSHTVLPDPPAMARGFKVLCADHEWKTWAVSKDVTSELVSGVARAVRVGDIGRSSRKGWWGFPFIMCFRAPGSLSTFV